MPCAPSPTPGHQTWLPFPALTQLEPQSAAFQIGFSHSDTHFRLLLSSHDKIAHFLLLLNNIPLSGWTTVTHPPAHGRTSGCRSGCLPRVSYYRQRHWKHITSGIRFLNAMTKPELTAGPAAQAPAPRPRAWRCRESPRGRNRSGHGGVFFTDRRCQGASKHAEKKTIFRKGTLETIPSASEQGSGCPDSPVFPSKHTGHGDWILLSSHLTREASLIIQNDGISLPAREDRCCSHPEGHVSLISRNTNSTYSIPRKPRVL